MGCGCNGGAGTGGRVDTLGYYVVLPDGTMLPSGVNPDDPDMGAPPYMLYTEAHNQAVMSGAGTVYRLRRSK